jgi:trigger factor
MSTSQLIKNFSIKGNSALFSVVVNSDEYLALVAKHESEYLKTVKVDGFRPGNVPKDIAMKNINPIAFEAYVLEKVINSNSEAVHTEALAKCEEEKRNMIKISIDDSEGKGVKKEDNGDLTYFCIAKLLPIVDLNEITKLTPQATDMSGFISKDKFIEIQKASFLKEMNEYTVADETAKAKEGDKVTLDFSGTMDGVSNPSLNSDKYTVILGSKEFLEDFETAIYGMKNNETKNFQVVFPMDYFASEMQGKTVEFTAHIQSIEIAKFSTLAEIIESSEEKKAELESEEKVMDYINERFEAEKANYQKDQERANFMEFLVKETPAIDLDAAEVDKQTESIFTSILESSKEAGVSLGEVFAKSGLRSEKKNLANLDSLQIREEVEQNVREELKLQYIYLTVIYKQELKQPEPEYIEQYAKQIAASPKMYGFPENLSQEELTNILIDRMMKSEAFNWLKENTSKVSK